MPGETALQYPFPYKTGDGEENFQIDNLTVFANTALLGPVTMGSTTQNTNNIINGNLLVTGTITGTAFAPIDTAVYFVATQANNQYQTNNVSAQFDLQVTAVGTPTFNLKDSSGSTNTSTLNANTINNNQTNNQQTTSVYSNLTTLTSTQKNISIAATAESGYEAINNANTKFSFLMSGSNNTNFGILRTTSTAAGIQITTTNAANPIQFLTNSIKRFEITDAGVAVSGTLSNTGIQTNTNNTPSTTTATGALQIGTGSGTGQGGLGVAGNIYLGGNLVAAGTISTLSGSYTLTNLTLTNNTPSTSPSTGTEIIGSGTGTGQGGLGVAGNIFLGGNLSSALQLISTIPTGTPPLSITSTTVVPNLNVSQLLGSTWQVPGQIGLTTANTGAFSTLSATGVITSTLPTGTAPLSITSTTVVPNLNVSQLLGSTWQVPGQIGLTTPNSGAFTTLSNTGIHTNSNNIQATTIATGALRIGTGSGSGAGVGGLGVAGNIYNGGNLITTGYHQCGPNILLLTTYSQIPFAANITFTASQLYGGMIKITGTPVNVAVTTDTAANIIALVGSVVGTTFGGSYYYVPPLKPFNFTAGTGVTIFDQRPATNDNNVGYIVIVSSATTVDFLIK